MKKLVLASLLLSNIVMASTQLPYLDVTEGNVTTTPEGKLQVNDPQMRLVTRAVGEPKATVVFTYHGPTTQVSHLDNGEVRHQFGLKLKARDACNLVYVMWNFDTATIHVSVKSNPTQNNFKQCGDRGYITNMVATVYKRPPAMEVNVKHTMTAAITGNMLRVMVDNVDVWEGSLDPIAETLTGPVGIRSDNVHATFEIN